MPRRPQSRSPEIFKQQVREFIASFEKDLNRKDLREKVLLLVNAFRHIRDFGSSLIPRTEASSAQDRILHYFLKYPLTIIHGDELMVVSGIQEYARRVRELRVQMGWAIVSGKTLKLMAKDGDVPEGLDASKTKPEEYILLSEKQDRDAAFRWKVANNIRREKISTKEKILRYFRVNVGQKISAEELQYLAGKTSEWGRRIRELRTEEGWPIVTRFSGDPDLPAGFYVLERDQQTEVHDRKIPDSIRAEVLERDNFKCTSCGWDRKMRRPEDPRQFLELHHLVAHAKGGENSAENLTTLCNVCHDRIHAEKGK